MKWKSKMNSPFFNATVFTSLAFLIFLFTKPHLSYAGDMNIAEYLSSSKIKCGFFFISPVLAAALRGMNHIVIANWWGIFSIIVMFSGLFVFLWFSNKRFNEYELFPRLLLSLLFLIFFWEAFLKYEINFTQTAVIAGLAGIVLIVDCSYRKNINGKLTILKIATGVGFLVIAGAIRWKALALMLPFALMCLLYIFIFPYSSDNINISLKNSFKNKNKRMVIGLLFTITATVLMSKGIHEIYGIINPDLGEYVEANALREDIVDYTERYPAYADAEGQYEELGIKKSWKVMLHAFITSDMNHFTSGDLGKMIPLRQDSKIQVLDYAHSLRGHALLWCSIISLCIYIMVLKGRKNVFIPLLGCIYAFFLCALLFVFMGRIVWRVTNGYILACMISFIVMSSYPIYEEIIRKFDLVGKTALFALLMMSLMIGCVAVKEEKGKLSIPKMEVTNQSLADILDYMNSNSDTIYLDLGDELRFYCAHNIWSSHAPEYLKNNISLIAHFVIGEKENLADFGVYDLYKDMLEKPNIYIKYSKEKNPVLLAYMEDYYGSGISISVADEYNSVKFLRYSKPVMPEKVEDYSENINVFFEIADDFLDDDNILQAIKLNFGKQMFGGGYKDYYVNIVDNLSGKTYSYGLNQNDSECYGEILQLNETWKLDDSSAFLIAQDFEGNNIVIADVSDELMLSIQSRTD